MSNKPKLKYYNPNTQEWEQIAPTKEEFDDALNEIDDLSQDIGNLNSLTTEEQSNLVGAINEIDGAIDTHRSEEASSSQLGHVKVDDTTIIADNGVITALPVQSIGGWTGAVLDGCELDGGNVELTQSNVNLVPLMTSNTTPEGVASASSILSPSNDAYYAFNKNYSDGWASDSIVSWLRYEFVNPRIINKYTVSAWAGENIAPKNWTLQGSNNGTDWTILDTQTNQTSWTLGEAGKREYNFINDTSYLYYQISVTENNGHGSRVGIGEFEMFSVLTSGTFCIDHTPPNLIGYGNIFYNKYIPAVPGTQTVTLAVKDTSDNVLIADVQDNASLSSIDPMTYPTIRIHGTLTRADAGDDSPRVGAPLISYIGTATGGE